jgi:hypothetical protein
MALPQFPFTLHLSPFTAVTASLARRNTACHIARVSLPVLVF